MSSATIQAPGKVTTWNIDPVHSNVEFAVKHMVVSTVRGRFREVSGAIHLNEADQASSWVEATIPTASVDTAEPQRDAHLRSQDFFDSERYPAMTFRSTKVEHVAGERWRVTGDLTIRDVTKEVVLDTEYGGQIQDAYGKQRSAFEATAELNRKDFGLQWNVLLEAGGVAVGDKVRVTLNIAAVREN